MRGGFTLTEEQQRMEVSLKVERLNMTDEEKRLDYEVMASMLEAHFGSTKTGLERRDEAYRRESDPINFAHLTKGESPRLWLPSVPEIRLSSIRKKCATHNSEEIAYWVVTFNAHTIVRMCWRCILSYPSVLKAFREGY